jgi:hypothetical protein
MVDTEALLGDLGKFLAHSFKDAIIWEQRDAGLLGKYVYLKYKGKEIGVFLGYFADQSATIKSCMTFFFAHPTSNPEERSEVSVLFHKLLIRLNLRVKGSPFKLLTGRSPALMRTMHFADGNFSPDAPNRFFAESLDVIKTCEPVYKAASQ